MCKVCWLKTQLQFGKLFLTAALATERSQRQSITLQGGGLSQQIVKKLDDYDENRNFLMGQYFRNNYNKTMARLPVVNSQVQILRIEVWITNRTGTTTQARTVVGLMDLGENNPYNTNIHSLTTNSLPQNGANDLYGTISRDSSFRMSSIVNSRLVGLGLKPVEDYEKTFARQLLPTEYYLTGRPVLFPYTSNYSRMKYWELLTNIATMEKFIRSVSLRRMYPLTPRKVCRKYCF